MLRWIDVQRKGMDIRVDRLVGLEVERDLLLLPFVRQDGSNKKHETIRRHPVVQLETLLRRGDGREHRETVDTGLDVGRSTVFLR